MDLGTLAVYEIEKKKLHSCGVFVEILIVMIVCSYIFEEDMDGYCNIRE